MKIFEIRYFFVLLHADYTLGMNVVQNHIKLPLCNLDREKRIFEVDLTGDFFSIFGNFEILQSKVNAKLTAEKIKNFVSVKLNFSGEITVACDRCLEELIVPVNGENILSLKFGNASQNSVSDDDTEDVMYVNDDADEVDLGEYVYESVCLALPIQRVHGNDKKGNSLCNPEMLKYISNSD